MRSPATDATMPTAMNANWPFCHVSVSPLPWSNKSLPISSSLSGSLASVPATEQVNPSAPILAGQLQHEGVETICSPMPGMYYRSPAPEDPSYVEVGSIVSEEDIVGLIEAMKIFNEVKPGFACEILEILVENATAVEFDQPLFRVKKN